LAQHRAVVFIGDGPNVSHMPLKATINALAENLGVVSHAIPIADLETKPGQNDTIVTRRYYNDNLTSPALVSHGNKDVYGTIGVSLPAGLYSEANSFRDVQGALGPVLNHAMF
jgi:hypothetical protein